MAGIIGRNREDDTAQDSLQQLVRIDRETKQEIPNDLGCGMLRYAEALIPNANAVVVSDYDKGVITPEILTSIFDCAQKFDKPVVVDPKMRNFWHYGGATVITPNQKEASQASGIEIVYEDSLLLAGQELLRQLGSPAVLTFLSRSPLLKRSETFQFPPRLRRDFLAFRLSGFNGYLQTL